MSTYFRLLKYLKPYKGRLALAVVCILSSTLLSGAQLGFLVPLVDNILSQRESKILAFSQAEKCQLPLVALENARLKIMDFFQSTPPNELLKIILIFALIVFALKAIFDFGKAYLSGYIGERVIADLRNQLYAHIQTLSLEFFSKRRTGQIISRVTNDVQPVKTALGEQLCDFLFGVSQVAVYASIIFFIHWELALASLIILPLVVYPIVHIGQRLRKITSRFQEKIADVTSFLQETISGIRIVRSFSMEDYETRKFNQESERLFKLRIKTLKRVVGLSPLTEFVGSIGAIFVLWYGVNEVIKGILSPGTFILFLAALLSIIKPFKKLSQTNNTVQQGIAAGARIFEMLDVKSTIEEKMGSREIYEPRQTIAFKNISFYYHPEEVILQDITLDVKIGEIVALIGPSGVGKTTLLNLLPRFYDPQEGKVEIDGLNIKDVKIKSLRHLMGIVSQEMILFNDTIRNNIAYGKLDANFDEIINAAKAAHAHEFIMKFPQQYNTMIGDRGMKLSGGEQQRIAIARAILKNPPILILDEATSALDSESERLVQDALNNLMGGKTTFLIAHRLATVRRADKIVVMFKGRIVGIGRHEKLIETNPLYRRLYDMQFKE